MLWWRGPGALGPAVVGDDCGDSPSDRCMCGSTPAYVSPYAYVGLMDRPMGSLPTPLPPPPPPPPPPGAAKGVAASALAPPALRCRSGDGGCRIARIAVKRAARPTLPGAAAAATAAAAAPLPAPLSAGLSCSWLAMCHGVSAPDTPLDAWLRVGLLGATGSMPLSSRRACGGERHESETGGGGAALRTASKRGAGSSKQDRSIE
eukprot:364406-Chlamydomonas_euryale.AAC.15